MSNSSLRNTIVFFCFSVADDDEIDLVVDSIQNRCATVKRIEHIGIHSIFVYLKFSSKEAAAQGFHLLNNWKYHGNLCNILNPNDYLSCLFSRSRNYREIPSS